MTAPSSPDRIDEWARVIQSAIGCHEDCMDSEHHDAAVRIARALDAYDREHPSPEVKALRELAERNWQSWEREALAHARTLGLIGAPRTGEPLSEGEERRFEEAVVRGLQAGRAEAEADLRERIATDIEARRIVCPVHGMPDCSPLLNGCPIPNMLVRQRDEDAARIARGGA